MDECKRMGWASGDKICKTWAQSGIQLIRDKELRKEG